MKKICKIAGLEIRVLFYSPVAWLVLTIFMVQCGMQFFGMLGSLREALSMGISESRITHTLFPGLNGVFDKVQQSLYLYIPLLTMGLMSRETSSGSIKLLLSSPVKAREIVWGKYLAMAVYGLLLIAILAMYAGIAMIIVKDADTGLLLSGLAGLYMLICTYAAIGLFMSSLTAYQVVAAISTLAVFAALRFVGTVWQDVNVVRDITYFLSLSGRTEDLLNGLMTTRDICYFLLIILFFLYLCILRLQFSRQSRHWTAKGWRYALLCGVLLLLGYVSARPRFTGYRDVTATHSMTLTGESRRIAEQIKGPLKITTYVNLLDDNVYVGLPVSRNYDLAKFDQYRRFIPGLQFSYVYYYHGPDAAKVAENMGLDVHMFMPPAAIDKQIDLSGENYRLVRQLEYNGKKSWLRFYDGVDRFPYEAEISAAIKRLLVPVPQVAFVTGEHERSIDNRGDHHYQRATTLKDNRHALLNQGFDVTTIDLHKAEIPPGLAVLVLADPVSPLDTQVLRKVHQYIGAGGNMLIATEPGREKVMAPLLSELGIRMRPGMLVSAGKNEEQALVYAGGVAFPGAATFEYDTVAGFRVDVLAKSKENGWWSPQLVDPAVPARFDAARDQRGAFPVVIELTRKQQRIVVTGDADFMNNASMKHPQGMNQQLVSGLFGAFADNVFPVNVHRPPYPDDNIFVKRKDLSVLNTVFTGILPAMLVALGAFILLRRKRY